MENSSLIKPAKNIAKRCVPLEVSKTRPKKLTQKKQNIIRTLFSSLKTSFNNLFIPKNLIDLVKLSKVFLTIPIKLIQLSAFIFIPLILISLIFNLIVDPEFLILPIMMLYGYFILAFNLLIWFIIPPGLIILLSKLLK